MADQTDAAPEPGTEEWHVDQAHAGLDGGASCYACQVARGEIGPLGTLAVGAEAATPAATPVVEGSAIHEILARELFVSNHVHGKPGSRREARGLWYDGLTGLGREAWRMEASWLIDSLGESRISLTMGQKT